MLNRKQTNRVFIRVALSIYILMILYGALSKLVMSRPALVQDEKKICNISTLCAGHSRKEHLKWDREGKRLAVECKKNNYRCHPYRD